MHCKISILFALIKGGAVLAFSTPLVNRIGVTSTATSLFSAVADTSVLNDDKLSDKPVAWNCDDDANCVEVDPCDDKECRTSLDVRIHGQWYDLSGE